MARIICETSQLPRLAGEQIVAALQSAISQRGATSISLAGGTTPRATYEVLATISGIPWPEVSVFFGDERAVPPDHPDSNYRMACEALFDRVDLPRARIHRMEAELDDGDLAARRYEAQLPTQLDVLILGIGEDGHTASLFPGSSAVRERQRKVLPVIGPKPPPKRLTITAPVIEQARTCFVLASGAGKADAVKAALEGDESIEACPARLARSAVWIVDHAAAAKLSG